MVELEEEKDGSLTWSNAIKNTAMIEADARRKKPKPWGYWSSGTSLGSVVTTGGPWMVSSLSLWADGVGSWWSSLV